MKIPANRDEFISVYNDLQHRFAAMQPELEVTVRDTAHDVEGYVVVWNTGISRGGPLDGCGKGGTRIMPNLKLDDIKRLARAMAEKNAAAGLPLGGAKSGMRGDPSDPAYETKFRQFVKAVKNSNILSEQGGIFGGFGYDIGCKPPLNAIWACEELGSRKSFTGKPLDMGGTDYDREGVAGLGVATAAKAMLEHYKHPVAGASFTVQGLGAMGAAVLRYFSGYGGQVKALADPKYGGTWTFEKNISGILLDALIKQNTDIAKGLLEKEGVFLSENVQDVLTVIADVAFPCAIEDVITKDNVGQIGAKFLCEGANNPTTAEAHAMLHKRGIKAVPDIIANPGGIIAAFVEMTMDNDNKAQAAKDMTIERVTANTRDMLALCDRFDIPADMAGDFMAWSRIFKQ